MPRRNSKKRTADTVLIPNIPGFKPKGKPRGKPFAKGQDERRNTEQLFQEGNRANPGGQPKGMKEIRAEFLPKVPAVLTALWVSALGGRKDDETGRRRPMSSAQVQAAKEFMDRITGKAPQPITGADIEKDLGDGDLLTALNKMAGIKAPGGDDEDGGGEVGGGGGGDEGGASPAEAAG